MINVIVSIIVIIAVLFLLLRFYVIPTQSKLPKSIQMQTFDSNTSEHANHTLSPCPDKPNCVSSTASIPSQKIEPFKFSGSAKDAINRLADISTALPKSQIHNKQSNYLHVIFKSPLMNFVDDTEFLADESSGLIQIRSAARLGHSDLDKNRQRIELIRQSFE